MASILLPTPGGLKCPVVKTRCSPGDIVVGRLYDPTRPAVIGPGSILTINSTTGKVFTIAPKFTTVGTLQMGANWVEMGADNSNLLVGYLPQPPSTTIAFNGVYMHRVGPGGVRTVGNTHWFVLN